MQLNLYPSRYFLAFILLCHVSAMLVILALPLQWWVIIIVEVLLAANFVHMIQKYILRKSNKTIVCLWLEQPQWVLMDRAGNKMIGSLLKDSTSSPVLVVLNFKLNNGKRKSVVIFSDSIDKPSFSKLRRYLKTQIK